MVSIRYDEARTLLNEAFAKVEASFEEPTPSQLSPEVQEACEVVFQSSTQAYREVLLGCLLARTQDHHVDVSQPYVGQGVHAFNGQTLDERVINPFLRDKQIPCSRGPYLNVFRRSVRLDESTRAGLRDKTGYDAMLTVVSYMGNLDGTGLDTLLGFLLRQFLRLREAAIISLSRLQRMSLPQFDLLLTGLLRRQSGGRFPVLMVVAALKTL